MDLVQYLAVLLTIKEDFDFAKKYNLEIKTVVKPKDKDETFKVINEAYPGPGTMIILIFKQLSALKTQ